MGYGIAQKGMNDLLYHGEARGMALLRRVWHDLLNLGWLSGVSQYSEGCGTIYLSRHGSVGYYGIIKKGVARIIVSRYGSVWHDLLYQGVAQ